MTAATATEQTPAQLREEFIARALAKAPAMSAERRHRIATVLFGQSGDER